MKEKIKLGLGSSLGSGHYMDDDANVDFRWFNFHGRTMIKGGSVTIIHFDDKDIVSGQGSAAIRLDHGKIIRRTQWEWSEGEVKILGDEDERKY